MCCHRVHGSSVRHSRITHCRESICWTSVKLFPLYPCCPVGNTAPVTSHVGSILSSKTICGRSRFSYVTAQQPSTIQPCLHKHNYLARVQFVTCNPRPVSHSKDRYTGIRALTRPPIHELDGGVVWNCSLVHRPWPSIIPRESMPRHKHIVWNVVHQEVKVPTFIHPHTCQHDMICVMIFT